MRWSQWMVEISEWLWRLILANICWIMFTFLGLGVFGFFPSSVALFTVVRKWLKNDLDTPVWKTFKHVYFKEWKRSNKLGLVFYGIAIFLFLDIRIVEAIMTGVFSVFLLILLWMLVFILVLSMGYFFAIYVHYEFSNKQYIKQSVLLSVTSTKTTLWIGAGVFFIGYLIHKLPGLILFISAIFPAYWMMKICLKRFERLEEQVINH